MAPATSCSAVLPAVPHLRAQRGAGRHAARRRHGRCWSNGSTRDVGARGHRAATASPSLTGAPAMWATWAHLPDLAGRGSPRCALGGVGAARLDPAVAAAMQRAGSASTVTEGYGLTEASPVR